VVAPARGRLKQLIGLNKLRKKVMTTEADPIVGNWYEHLDKGQKFEVIEVDEDRGIVEIQYFDGDLDQIDLDEWYNLEIEPIEAPEDWSGPMNDIEKDDLGYSEAELEEEQWSPRSRKPKRRWDEEEEVEEEDEWGEGYPDEEPWRGED